MRTKKSFLLTLSVLLTAAVFVFAQKAPDRTGTRFGDVQVQTSRMADFNTPQKFMAKKGNQRIPARDASSYSIITEQPEGELKTYTRAGGCYFVSGSDLYYTDQSGTIDIVWGTDGKVYFKDIVSGTPAGTWVYGTVSSDGSTISVPLGQNLYYVSDYDACLAIQLLKYDSGFNVDTEATEVVFTVEGDALYMQGTAFADVSLAVVWTDDGAIYDYGDYESVFTYYPVINVDYSSALFYDDFESGDLSQWTIYTLGEASEAGADGWHAGTPADWDICNAHSGDYVATSWSWNSSALHADNWLVTPKVALGGSVSFWVYTNKNYPDSYEVLLSTGGNAVSDFTVTLQEMAPAPATGVWELVTIDLSAYAGKEGYIAIHHSDYDNNYLFIDDFAVFGAGGGAAGGSAMYDFEDGSMQGWTTIDANGDGYTWMTTSSKMGSGYGHNGSSNAVMSQSYDNNVGALSPDNYLVSPKITLGGKISFYACAQDAAYPAEVFGVAVSTKGNTAAADFTMVQNWTMTAAPSNAPKANAPANAFRSPQRVQGNWYKYEVDLSAYSGEGYVAIRHYNCYDNFYLIVDDIELISGEAGAGYALSSVSDHGKVTFTVNGQEVTKAEAGQTVTVTVTPDNGFEVDNITATAYADWDEAQSPQQNVSLLKDIDLTAVGENTWTFVMVGAKVEVTVTYKKNVELNLTGGDITAALNEASEGLPLNDVKLTLAEGDYTVSEPITAGGTIEIDGKNATIDASGNSGAFIVLEGTNELAKKEDGTDSDHKLVNLVEVSGLTITDLNGSFIKDNQKTLLEILYIDNCVIQMPASNKNFIDFNGKGYVGVVQVKNSTIWASGKNTGFFAQYGSRPKNVNGNLEQVFDIRNSDIINIANGKNVCDLKQNGTAQNVYTLKDNIFVDCGKNGQTVVGFNKGQNSATPQWDVTGNYFEWGGACTNDAEISKAGQKDGEDIVKDCVYGAPDFADAANGDFTLGETSELLHSRTGDPRWFGNNLQPIGGGLATDPIEVVPVTKSDPANPIDLSLLLKGELEFSPNPASITFKLRPDEHYIVSEPLTVGTRITIMTDGEDPANIDCSMLNGPMVQMDNYRSLLPADENGFIPVNNVTFQNILVRNLKYGLFSTQRARYIIDYLTIDNCILYADSQIDFLDFTNGGVLQELNIINSTLANRGAGLAQIYNAENSNNPVDANVKVQKLNINNSTLSKVKGFTHPATSTAELQIKVLNNVVAASPNFCVSLNGDQNTVVQFNAFANPVAWTMIEDDEVWVGKDYRLSEPLATGSIEGDVIFLNSFDNQVDFSLGECAAKEAEVGDPRWLIARMYVTLGLIEYAKRDLSWIVNEGLKKGFNMFILPEPADDDPYLYLKTLKSINVDKPLYIKSNPKIRVFAGLNADPFIVLSDEPAVKKINDYWRLNLIRLRGLWVICMRNSIIWDNKQKYCVENLKIDDCVLSMTPLPGDLDGMPERLRTKECKFESHIAFEQGGVKDFSIINSTVCDNKDKAVAKYFIRYNNSARLDRYGYDKDKDFQTMTYKNNTFYGMLNADGQWGNYNGISGQKYSKFDIEKNIWYNCGKDIIRRLSGGRIADGAPVKFFQNTYVNDGEILDESGYDKSETQLNSMPKFKFEVTQVYTPDYFHYDDYTLCTSSEQLFYKTGDPRWVENGGFADGYHWDPKLGMPVADSRTGDTDAIETVEANKADGEWYTIQGVRVDKPTKGLFIHNGRKVVIK